MTISIHFWKERSLPPLADIFNFLRGGRFDFFTGILFFLPISQSTWLHDLGNPSLFLKMERESGRKSAMSYWPNSLVLPYVLIATFKLRVYRKNQYLSMFHKKLYGISKIGCEWMKSSNFMILRIVQSGHVNCPFFEIGYFVLCLRLFVT